MNIALLIIVFLYPFLFKFIEQYFSQKGTNAAQIEDSRELAFETKKGEDLATKEDIKEITAQIETVKNEISFENQRRHEFIQQRTNRLLNILYLTEKLNEYQSILLYSLYEGRSSDSLISLIEHVNDTLLKLLHESRIVYVTVKDKELHSIISELKNKAQDYALYMCYIASTASSHMINKQSFLDLSERHNNSCELLKEAVKSSNAMECIRKEFENEISAKKDSLYDYQIKYLSKLNRLFDCDFHLRLDSFSENDKMW